MARSVCSTCSSLLNGPKDFQKLTNYWDRREPHLTAPGHLLSIILGKNSGCPLCEIFWNAFPDHMNLASDGLRPHSIPSCPDFFTRLRAATNEDCDEDIHLLNIEIADNTGLRLSAPGSEWSSVGSFEVSAREGSLAATKLTSRPFVRHYSSLDSIRQINDKLQECSTAHEDCAPITTSILPRRVIDVEEPCRLVELKTQAHYTVLSYVWGVKEQPVMATSQTLPALFERLPTSGIPLAIQDAITVTRSLGIKYLWVDSLCITQDDKMNKSSQIAEIPRIFSNAYICIYAAGSNTCLDGFLDPPELKTLASADFELPCRFPDGIIDNLIIQGTSTHNIGVPMAITTRAWTLEERLLSPRLLIYTPEHMYWECQEGRWSFGCHTRGSEEAQAVHRDDSRLDSVLLHPGAEEPTTGQLASLRLRWLQILENYTQRKVTDPRDRFRAIAGLASRFQTVFDGYKYIAGLWHGNITQVRGRSFLLHQLMWAEARTQPGEPNPSDKLAPSWSWASVGQESSWTEQPFPFSLSEEPVEDGMAEIIGCYAKPLVDGFPFGRVVDAWVTIKGPLRVLNDVQFRFLDFRANPYLSSDQHVYDQFMRAEPDRRFCEEKGALTKSTDEKMEIHYLRLIGRGGLLLVPVDEDHEKGRAYRRVGYFWMVATDEDDADGNKALEEGFFAKGDVSEVTIV